MSEEIEAIRRHPTSFVGDTGVSGLHVLLDEVVENSFDEALAGHATMIQVTLLRDGSCSVADDGRGIPVDVHRATGLPALEVCLTRRAGSGSLHGLVVVNALSRWLEVEVSRDGSVYHQRFEWGVPVSPLERLGATRESGTRIAFLPDPVVFQDAHFDVGLALRRWRPFARPGLELTLRDERA